MIGRLIGFSVDNRPFVIFLVLLVAALGVRAARQLPIDAVPDVTNVQVQVLTRAPALGPLEVEQFITFPVETVMSGLPGLAEVRSVSRFGLSAVTVVFEEGTDLYFARQLVAERLQQARDAIPRGYGSPEMGPISTGLGEVFQFEVRGDPMCAPGEPIRGCHTPMELRSLLDWFISTQLRAVPGVVEVNAFGGELKTYEVQLDPARLTALRIPLRQVFEAIERNNENAGGAYIARAGEQYLIRGEGLVQSLADIRRIVVAARDEGTPLTVGDLGTVAIAPRVRQGAVTRDGRGEVVIGMALMLMGENSREVALRVRERLEELAESLPEGVTVEPFYDRTELVDRTIRTVALNLVEGGALVVLVLLLLLGNLRAGLLVASTIPLSMLAAFIAMRQFGVSGNLMSLGAIDFGLIVDGSVVIIDSAMRRLGAGRVPDAQARERVGGAAREVGRPVTFAVVIIMLVYVPVFALEGIEGKMFRPMAFTVLCALGASLLLALTWVPALASLILPGSVRAGETRVLRAVSRVYEPLLRRAVDHVGVTLALAFALLASAATLVPFLGAEFAPTLDEGALAMEVVRLPSVSLEESVRATTRLEQALRERFPDEVATVVSKTGSPEIATDPMGVQQSDVYVGLTPRVHWTRAESKAALVAEMERALRDEVPEQRYAFSQPIELRTNELLSGVRSDVAISIYGEDLGELERIGAAVARVLRRVPGAAGVKADQVAGMPFLRVRVNRDRIARYGIDARDVLDAVSAMGGHRVGEVFEGQRRFALQVRYVPWARSDLGAIRKLPIATPEGTLVPLGQLADLAIETGPVQVNRDRVQRRMTVQANVRGRDLSGFVQEAKARLDAEGAVPRGYFAQWGGQFRNLEQASGRLAIALPVALLLIALLLTMAYGAVRPALLVYLNVPFAAVGGVFALAARGMPLSISAGVGFIALFGIAVLNGVVLVSHIRDLQLRGLSREGAARQGARDRVRPVMMTALVASLGFVPMALARSAGAEVQRPLATVVIGGLVGATLLTLLVLPAVYARWGGEGPAAPDQNT